jgi:protein-S-isoprenylcysteine O-methyltransferase Ste14
MNSLELKALAGFLGFFVAMVVLLFIPAWTLDYWQAWVFLPVLFLPALAITVYLMKKDPQLLARRVHAGPTAEKETSQKIIQFITSIGYTAMLVVPALDHRFHWSRVSFYGVVAGDVLVVVAFLIIFFVYRENTFASATIETYPDQKVVSTGLYAMVRHPMYTGGLLLFIGMSLSLGSWWGLLAYLLMIPALIWRIHDEERLLTKNLPDYGEYKNKVRYRLIPFVW